MARQTDRAFFIGRKIHILQVNPVNGSIIVIRF
jgi:hypothetical protein